MRTILATACLFGIALLTGFASWSAAPSQAKKISAPPVEEKMIDLQGRVVCLAEEMNRLHDAQLPTRHEHLYGFRTKDGSYYTLLRTKWSEALFADERVREKELLVKGRVFTKTQILELVGALRSVHDGKVHDLYYYCDICDIYTIAPGICECCQDPTVLVEKPL